MLKYPVISNRSSGRHTVSARVGLRPSFLFSFPFFFCYPVSFFSLAWSLLYILFLIIQRCAFAYPPFFNRRYAYHRLLPSGTLKMVIEILAGFRVHYWRPMTETLFSEIEVHSSQLDSVCMNAYTENIFLTADHCSWFFTIIFLTADKMGLLLKHLTADMGLRQLPDGRSPPWRLYQSSPPIDEGT